MGRFEPYCAQLRHDRGRAMTRLGSGPGPWPLLLAGKQTDVPAITPTLLDRLVELIGPALARHLLHDTNITMADGDVIQSRLANR
ncbi:MAG: hypothetical protein HQ502_19150, partial [Alphaproteobacteria bacterium]|nr:hypothetical protein [Alphaproteobacteria bacterium]